MIWLFTGQEPKIWLIKVKSMLWLICSTNSCQRSLIKQTLKRFFISRPSYLYYPDLYQSDLFLGVLLSLALTLATFAGKTYRYSKMVSRKSNIADTSCSVTSFSSKCAPKLPICRPKCATSANNGGIRSDLIRLLTLSDNV